MNLDVPVADERRIEVAANGSSPLVTQLLSRGSPVLAAPGAAPCSGSLNPYCSDHRLGRAVVWPPRSRRAASVRRLPA